MYAKIQNIEFPVYPYAIIDFSTVMFNNIYDFYLLKLKMSKKANSFFKMSLINTALLSGLSLLLVVGFKLGALGKLGASLFTSVILFTYLLPRLTKKSIIDRKIFIDAFKFTWPLIIAGSLGYFFTGVDRAFLLTLDDTVQYTLSVSGNSAGNAPSPTLPKFENLSVVGTSQSSSFSFINGQTSVSKSFLYTLRPEKTGQAHIGQATININGQNYTTEPIDIKVTKAEGKKTQPGPQAGARSRFPNAWNDFDDFF